MPIPTHRTKPHSDWTPEEIADVAEVTCHTCRDDTGISYDVTLTLRSLAASAYEQGEDQCMIWDRRVDFGTTPAFWAGGHAFRMAAREQQDIADELAKLIWPTR